jgi:type II secretory pathway pseudopilin PulG
MNASHDGAPRRGVSLMELLVAGIVMLIILNFGIPNYRKGMAQARVDMAGTHLFAIYTAQRMYRAENSTYADNLGGTTGMQKLITAKLVDPAMIPGPTENKFTYSIDDGANATDFTARATWKTDINGVSEPWAGAILINQTGTGWGGIDDSPLTTPGPTTTFIKPTKYQTGI